MRGRPITINVPRETYEAMIEALAERLAETWSVSPKTLLSLDPKDRETLRKRAESYLDSAFDAARGKS